MDDFPGEGRAGSSLAEEITQLKIRVRPAPVLRMQIRNQFVANFRHKRLAMTRFRPRNLSPHSSLFTSMPFHLTLLLELSRSLGTKDNPVCAKC